MIPKAAEVRLTPADRAMLEARVRAPTTEQRDVFRARIILLAAEGRSTRSIARTLDTVPRTVSLWRGRFSREGLSGLSDKPRPGSVPKYPVETGKRILVVLDRPPPTEFTLFAAFEVATGKVTAAASFTSVERLREHIDAFIESYNQNAKPFVWTKAKVHQRRFKGRRISEL
jgi:hypothetical protein